MEVAIVLHLVVREAFAASFLEFRGGHDADGVIPPSFEVERDQRFAGLCR